MRLCEVLYGPCHCWADELLLIESEWDIFEVCTQLVNFWLKLLTGGISDQQSVRDVGT